MNKHQDGEEEGESITLTDSSNMNVVELSIGGNDKQETREGYNRIEVNTNNYTSNGITVTNNGDGSLTLNGTNTSGTTAYIRLNADNINVSKDTYFNLIKDKNYYMDLCNTTLPSGVSLIARDRAASNPFISTTTSSIKTWTSDTTEQAIAFLKIEADVVLNNLTIRPMLAESDVEVPYEPYGAMPSPEYPSEVETVNTQASVVVSNKNILNFEEKSTSWNGSTITVAGNKIKFVGSETGDSGLSYFSSRQKVDLRKGTPLTYSSKYVRGELTAGNTYYHLNGVNKDGIVTKLINMNRQGVSDYKTDKQATYTLEEDIKEIYISGSSYTIEGLTEELVYEFQLEIGDTATEIIEHTEQTKTVDIQQEMLEGDYFIKEEDGWKEVHTWNKRVLDGTESWNLNSSFASTFYTNQNSNDFVNMTNDINKYKLLCNIYKYGGNIVPSANMVNNSIYGFKENETTVYKRINLKDTRFTTLEEFKSWLTQKYNEGNPVYVWYKLETPTKLVCTERQSQQLDDLLNTSTYKNVTHIYSTDKVSPIIKIKYKKDIETMLNSQKNDYDIRLSNIEKLLSTTTTSALLLDNLQTDLEKEVI